ncbi:MAG: CHAT domain-containing protein [Acidimicrobiales bacterium]
MADSLASAEHVPMPLHIHVLHGSLLFASYPVLVGHYRGDPIAGAEGYLDARLDGRLSNRQVLDRYPREIGEVVRLTNDRDRPPGALVVGLGGRGELTAAGLAKAGRDAALEHALRWLERPDARIEVATRSIGLTSVLLGTFGVASLTLPASVAAVVEGVALANDILVKRDLADQVRIGAIEFVELYATPAEEAAHVVRDIEQYVPATLRATVTLLPESRMRLGEGRRPARWAADYGAGIWRRLIVSGSKPDRDGRMQLEFTSLGAQAGADRHTHSVDVRLVGRMLRDSVQRSAVDGRVNTALFEMLFPNEVKRELASAENLQLVVDQYTADFPWEALSDRGSLSGARPLARRAGLLRQLQLDGGARLEAPSGVPCALVVGDPPAMPEFDRLPGARREAQAVADLLGATMPVEARIFDDAGPAAGGTADAGASILGALYATDYQIVHIAAHGFFNERANRPPYGGVVIGPGEYLTAGMFCNMRRPPDIVFLNCCHLATVGATADVDDPGAPAREAFVRQRANRLAASVSRQLMAIGVKAVVAAGWSVGDEPAARFATTFYGQMLSGATYGDAVRLAREEAFVADGGASNTWAAYQCYGDPGFRMVSKRQRKASTLSFVSAEELVRALEDIAVSAGEADDAYATELLKTVEGHRAAAEQGWPHHAEVLSTIGLAYGQLRDFENAVAWYRRALASDDAELPIKAVEQLANYEHRLAMALLEQGAETAAGLEGVASVTELRKKAGERLDVLDGLGETPGRRAYRAGWHKREALAAPTPDEAKAHITAAAREYLAGWRLSSVGGRRSDTYGAFNALQLIALGAQLEPSDHDELVAVLAAELGPGDDFFDRVAVGDRALTALSRGEMAGGVAEVAAAYRQVFADRSSPVERNSVIRHIDDLATLAEKVGAPAAPGLRQLADALPG